jgi:hypothetical protein
MVTVVIVKTPHVPRSAGASSAADWRYISDQFGYFQGKNDQIGHISNAQGGSTRSILCTLRFPSNHPMLLQRPQSDKRETLLFLVVVFQKSTVFGK